MDNAFTAFANPGHRQTPLSRAEMEQILEQGESVLYEGRIITKAQNLPSDAQLALGNPKQEDSAIAQLMAMQAQTQAQIDLLMRSRYGPDGPSAESVPSRPPTPEAAQAAPAAPTPAPAPAATPGTPTIPEDLKAAQRAALIRPDVPDPDDIAPVPPPPPPPLPDEVAKRLTAEAEKDKDKGKPNRK